MSSSILNFGAGPAALPREVLEEAAAALLNYNDTGLSILELPHRGNLFTAILEEANSLVRELLDLDDQYEVLWLQGGGRLQFSMLPMNFLAEDATAGYIDSGHWAAEAIRNASPYGNIQVLATSREDRYTYIPREWASIPEDLAYLHLTSNNTIYGTQFAQFPESNVPLVADMSSDIFSRQLDYKRFSMIYAVAQKNLGPAGVTLVVLRKSLLNAQKRVLPEILSYKEMAKHNSLLNTPPVFAIYGCLLNLRWIKKTGMATLEQHNKEKARLLYEAIDRSALFYGVARKESRSLMNVCFRMYTEEHQPAFLEYATANGITGIEGHRSVGGFRVSLYNAIRIEDVQQLITVMSAFEAQQ